jgi:hypothetical protein
LIVAEIVDPEIPDEAGREASFIGDASNHLTSSPRVKQT